MSVKFSPNALEQLFYISTTDKRKYKELQKIIRDTQRNGTRGLGRPELLTGDLAGFWSKRLNDEDRMVFHVTGDTVLIADCCTHYGDK